jgi:hypothetical protein
MDGDDILLTPRDASASSVMQQIVDAAPESLRWHSKGVMYDDNDRLIVRAYFACGGSSYQRRDGNVTTTDYEGAIKVILDLAGIEDETALRRLSDLGWFTGIVVDPSATRDSFRLGSAGICKVCGNQVKRGIGLEWRVCDTCAEKCDHQYVMGVGQVNGHLAHMSFCDVCGRADPSWIPNDDPMVDVLNTVASGDLAALVVQHPDGSSTLITQQ